MKRSLFIVVCMLAYSVQLSAKSFFTKSGLFVTSIAHNTEHLYVGTTSGLVTIEKASDLLTTDADVGGVFSLTESDGSLWLGQEGMRATSYFENTSLCFFKYDTWNTPPEESFVSSIAIGPEGQKAFTVWDNLVTCEQNDTTCWPLGVGYTEGMPEEIRYDSKGTLWIVCSGWGTSNLRSYTPEGGLKDVLADYGDNDIDLPNGKRGISSECLVIDANDHLWIGTKRGYLVEFDGTTFQVHRSQIGMTTITDLTIGENGLLWILAQTNSGQQLISFDGQEFYATALNLSDGERADCIHADGPVVYIGTNKRLISIYNGEVTTILSAHPFIEDGKVWVVRVGNAPGFPEESKIGYYFFNGDSIIDGHTCKIMKVVSDVTEDNWVNGVFTPGSLPQYYVGAFYEQDKKVYYTQYHSTFDQIYDFSLSSNDSFSSWGYLVVVQKMSGGIPGFKGTYYDLWRDDHIIGRWLEGIGCDTSFPGISHPWDASGIGKCTLLACSVGDEVIYYNSEDDYPYIMGARRGRFDFTHTTKIQPKTPIRREKSDEGSQLHGEYSEQQLGIYLDPLDDAYVVCITDETGKPVYEKAINAGSIVALNIDISTYAEGCYTVTVENSQEIFTGEFQVQTTGIEENVKIEKVKNESIYNLQGQRISSLQKGLNIVNGQKVYIK